MDAFLNLFDFSEPTSLYIHIPFCVRKCSYCAFYSIPGCSKTKTDAFVRRLLEEIRIINAQMGHRPYETVFIGGGNPGFLGAGNLGMIAQAVCQNGRPSEFTTEMNPESLSEEYFPLFQNCFTRLSMGVQSLDEKALSFLGRNSDLKSTLCGIELSQRLRRETGCVLNYDLITCLPSWHDALSDVKRITDTCSPEHLSVYALTPEEGTPMFAKRSLLPDSDAQFDILSGIWKYLESQGYEHYEVSNFAKKGFRCSHNCRYWAYSQYMGLGPAAASTAFSEDGTVSRVSFLPSLDDYCKGVLFGGYESETLTPQEVAEEMILMGLRYRGGVDLKRLSKAVGRDIGPDVFDGLEGFAVKGGFLVPDDRGMMNADAAALAMAGKLY